MTFQNRCNSPISSPELSALAPPLRRTGRGGWLAPVRLQDRRSVTSLPAPAESRVHPEPRRAALGTLRTRTRSAYITARGQPRAHGGLKRSVSGSNALADRGIANGSISMQTSEQTISFIIGKLTDRDPRSPPLDSVRGAARACAAVGHRAAHYEFAAVLRGVCQRSVITYVCRAVHIILPVPRPLPDSAVHQTTQVFVYGPNQWRSQGKDKGEHVILNI